MAELFPDPPPADPSDAPLGARMRPRTLDEFAGQQHILGPGKLLRRAIEADRIASILLYGPPGTGKTSLARIIAGATRCAFESLSGVEGNVADIRRAVASAANRLRTAGTRTILFVDEIHRFNKAQQDVLLPDVESGVVRLIGATTHNPFFYVNSPLVSRSQIFELQPLSHDDLVTLMRRALADRERGLGNHRVEIAPEALDHLALTAGGDARRCLNALEIGVLTTPPQPDGTLRFDHAVAEESIQRKAVVYDADGDQHYDTASAFIKSMRGSDPDAALYWLAKMLVAGEDPRFIARRIVICASEDVGMADPTALLVADAAARGVEFIGMPEAQLLLAHAVVHIATAPKSNRTTVAIGRAIEDVRTGRTLAVPDALRDAHYRGAKRLGRGEGYQYSHDFDGAFVAQAFLPEGRVYYEPGGNGRERAIGERLAAWRAAFEAARAPRNDPPAT